MGIISDVICDGCGKCFKVDLTNIEQGRFNECPYCHKKLTKHDKIGLQNDFQKMMNDYSLQTFFQDHQIHIRYNLSLLYNIRIIFQLTKKGAPLQYAQPNHLENSL